MRVLSSDIHHSNPVSCDGCGAVFCDDKCKEEAEYFHSHVCSSELYNQLQQTTQDAGGPAALLILKMLLINDDASLEDPIDRMCYAPCEEPVLTAVEEKQRDIISQIIGHEVSPRDWHRLRSAVKLNALPVWVSAPLVWGKLRDAGNLDIRPDYSDRLHITGYYPLASFFNHSCVPNVAMEEGLENSVVEFVATRDIAAGEELVIRYDDIKNAAARRQWLYNNYYFICKCPSCSGK